MTLPEEKQTQLKQNETKDIACDMLGGTTLKKSPEVHNSPSKTEPLQTMAMKANKTNGTLCRAGHQRPQNERYGTLRAQLKAVNQQVMYRERQHQS